MNLLIIDEIKSSQRKSLRIFRDFCEENNLKYYLTFGTLLGAVRHKGFIPWDDDVDVFMPRKDYEFLLKHFNENSVENREVISKEICPSFYLNSAKIIDRNTVVIEENGTLQVGVWIDIFPMDFLPSNNVKRFVFLCKIYLINRVLSYLMISLRKDRVWYKNLLVWFAHLMFPPQTWLEEKQQAMIAQAKSNVSGSDYALLYRYFGRTGVPMIPVSIFEPAEKLEFEGDLYNVPCKYDRFLRDCYGDYMTLPPKEKQKSHHSYACYWNEEKSEDFK